MGGAIQQVPIEASSWLRYCSDHFTALPSPSTSRSRSSEFRVKVSPCKDISCVLYLPKCFVDLSCIPRVYFPKLGSSAYYTLREMVRDFRH